MWVLSSSVVNIPALSYVCHGVQDIALLTGPRAPSSGLAGVTVDGLQPEWRVAGPVGRVLSGLRTTHVQTRLARSILTLAHDWFKPLLLSS